MGKRQAVIGFPHAPPVPYSPFPHSFSPSPHLIAYSIFRSPYPPPPFSFFCLLTCLRQNGRQEWAWWGTTLTASVTTQSSLSRKVRRVMGIGRRMRRSWELTWKVLIMFWKFWEGSGIHWTHFSMVFTMHKWVQWNPLNIIFLSTYLDWGWGVGAAGIYIFNYYAISIGGG